MDALDQAVKIIGLQPLAQLCGVSYQAVRKWQRAGRMPRTEWTGETDYASRIETATKGLVSREALLKVMPRPAASTRPSEGGHTTGVQECEAA